MAQKEKDRITARTVHDYCISPFMVYCEKFAPPEKKDPLTEFDQLLMEQGKVHENQVLKEKYPGLEKAQFESPSKLASS